MHKLVLSSSIAGSARPAACKEQCLHARASGGRQAMADVSEWAVRRQQAGSTRVASAEIIEACRTMLGHEERPAGGEPAETNLQMHKPSTVVDGSTEADATRGWGAADSLFTDEMFQAGCQLFTQFYKGESMNDQLEWNNFLATAHAPLIFSRRL